MELNGYFFFREIGKIKETGDRRCCVRVFDLKVEKQKRNFWNKFFLGYFCFITSYGVVGAGSKFTWEFLGVFRGYGFSRVWVQGQYVFIGRFLGRFIVVMLFRNIGVTLVVIVGIQSVGIFGQSCKVCFLFVLEAFILVLQVYLQFSFFVWI